MALMPRWRGILAPSHDRTVGAVEAVLAEQGWSVDREPVIGPIRPDIVARTPRDTYVIEVKQSEVDANLGSVAQVEAFRKALEASDQRQAHGVLLIAGRAPENLDQLNEAANGADVTLVMVESSDVDPIRASLTSAGIVDGVGHTGAVLHLDTA